MTRTTRRATRTVAIYLALLTALLALLVATPAAHNTPTPAPTTTTAPVGDDNGNGTVERGESGYPCLTNAPGAYTEINPALWGDATPVCLTR